MAMMPWIIIQSKKLCPSLATSHSPICPWCSVHSVHIWVSPSSSAQPNLVNVLWKGNSKASFSTLVAQCKTQVWNILSSSSILYTHNINIFPEGLHLFRVFKCWLCTDRKLLLEIQYLIGNRKPGSSKWSTDPAGRVKRYLERGTPGKALVKILQYKYSLFHRISFTGICSSLVFLEIEACILPLHWALEACQNCMSVLSFPVSSFCNWKLFFLNPLRTQWISHEFIQQICCITPKDLKYGYRSASLRKSDQWSSDCRCTANTMCSCSLNTYLTPFLISPCSWSLHKLIEHHRGQHEVPANSLRGRKSTFKITQR